MNQQSNSNQKLREWRESTHGFLPVSHKEEKAVNFDIKQSFPGTIWKSIMSVLDKYVFTDIPKFYPLWKKIAIRKAQSAWGLVWDVVVVLGSLLLCANYVGETYVATYEAQSYYRLSEIVLTYLFCIDFALSWGTSTTTKGFFSKGLTWIDLLTIIPVFLAESLSGLRSTRGIFQLFRFLRVFGLLRILKAFKKVYGLSEVNRQIAQLCLTILSLIFMAAGIINLLENDLKQYWFVDCEFSNVDTGYKPSCKSNSPDPLDGNCDCYQYDCVSVYGRFDPKDEPGRVRCTFMPFFECIYFIMVTISTVGYGDYSPTFFTSRVAICILVICTLTILPAQLNKLNGLIALKSPFRANWKPTKDQTHVMVCGDVSRSKIESFFREFFHIDRQSSHGPNLFALLLGQHEPSEDILSFIMSATVDGRLVYRVGSVLNADDLDRYSSHRALAVFFLVDPKADTRRATAEDMETALHVLAMEAYNPAIEILAQVSLVKDRVVMYDNEADVVLTLDDFKLTLMARNSICPGILTMVENLITSMIPSQRVHHEPWFNEYEDGVGKEVYTFEMDAKMLKHYQYSWSLVVEAIFIEFGMTLVGVCDRGCKECILNPTQMEIDDFGGSEEDFFIYHCLGVCIANSQSDVNELVMIESEIGFLDEITLKMYACEKSFSTGSFHKDPGDGLALSFTSSSQHSREENNKDGEADAPTGNEYTEVPMKTIERNIKRRKTLRSQRLMNEIKGLISGKDQREIANGEKKEDKARAISDTLKQRQKILQGQFDHTTALGVSNHMDLKEGEFKSIPCKENADDLRNHIVLMGIDEKVFIILRELRRPLIAAKGTMHPIIIFGDEPLKPIQHGEQLCEEVYFIQGERNSRNDLKKLNLSNAYSCLIFPNEKMADTDLLFQYLKLLQIIPDNVFLAVELINSFNLTVLNLKVLKYMEKGDTGFIRDDYLHTAQKEYTREHAVKTTTRAVQSKHAQRFVNRKKKDLEEYETHGKRDSGDGVGAEFFDFDNQPNSLPIYAGGRAFVAASFDSLLVQCFYTAIAASFYESLVIGQKYQAVLQITVPEHLVGKVYKDVFRSFIARNILVLGIFRAPTTENEATFDYVYTSPDLDTVLGENDRLYVYTNPMRLNNTLEEFIAIAAFEKMNKPKVDPGQVNIRVNANMTTPDGGTGRGSPRSNFNWF